MPTGHQESRYYITRTCYVLPQRSVLVNEGKTSRKIAELPFRLLRSLMERHDAIVPYEQLFKDIWNEPGHANAQVATVLNRLKQYFLEIGVSDDDFNRAFETVRGQGLLFSPSAPVERPIDALVSRLRQTGIPESDFADMIDCMLYRGISGRMGRERVFALARAGSKLAALEVAEMYFHGYVTRNHKGDYKVACEWYERAGEHPTALWTLGYCIMNNYWPRVEASRIDYLAARNYFERALRITTESGVSAAAYTSLGQLWEEGHFPEDDFAVTGRCKKRDMEQALKYYRLADERGYHYATNRLGRYYEGIGRRQLNNNRDARKQAFDYFQRSVSLVVDGFALNKLGLYYEQGFGCEANPARACECFMRGVEEVLEDDVTGWNLFNAARVCANRVKDQPGRYYDLPRAFDMFFEALRKLPVKDHDQTLLELLEILLYDDLSPLTPEAVGQKKLETLLRVNRFIAQTRNDPALQNSERTVRIRALSRSLQNTMDLT